MPTVVITGVTGLVGKALSRQLQAKGYTVVPILRKPNPAWPNAVLWNPQAGTLPTEALEGVEAVFHLAGEPIAQLWTAKAKQAILSSRQQGTRLLAETLSSLERPPKVLVSASAIGYYGEGGNTLLTEQSPSGTAFVSSVCKAWEEATVLASHAGLRVVNARIGVVLSPQGGALKAMLPAFRLGVAGLLGNGEQWMSWVSLQDVVSSLIFAMETPSVNGAMNVVAPHPVTNKEFTKTLASVLNRPAFLPAPAFVLKLALGGLAEELLLASAKVSPEVLQHAGFEFQHTELEAALRELLG
jgi:uncharacterized protein